MGSAITAAEQPVRRLARIETTPAALGIAPGVLARFAARLGPLAIVDLETTGLAIDDGAELLEFGAVLVDPGEERVTTLASLVRPHGPLPLPVKRLTGLDEADLAQAPPLEAVRAELCAALRGRRVVAHNAAFERALPRALRRACARGPRATSTRSTCSRVTHPDAPDLRLEIFTRALLGSEERHRALEDALDTARVIAAPVPARAPDGALRRRARSARSALRRTRRGSRCWRRRGDSRGSPAAALRRDRRERGGAGRLRRERDRASARRRGARAAPLPPATACARDRSSSRAVSHRTSIATNCYWRRAAPASASRSPTSRRRFRSR